MICLFLSPSLFHMYLEIKVQKTSIIIYLVISQEDLTKFDDQRVSTNLVV